MISDSNNLANDDEQALLVRLLAGDDAAFESLVRTFGPRMLAVARRLLGQEEDAQDALQQAFLAAFRHLHSFQGQSKIATWLHKIVINECLMKLRTKRRKPEIALDDLLPRFEDNGHREASPALFAIHDTTIQSQEVQQQVRSALERLPDAAREIIVLRDIEELDTETTAEQLGISESAVKTRLHRARMALRELLVPFMQGESS
jgi:RNA polymerase sigma-70 factor, ECF subfamily